MAPFGLWTRSIQMYPNAFGNPATVPGSRNIGGWGVSPTGKSQWLLRAWSCRWGSGVWLVLLGLGLRLGRALGVGASLFCTKWNKKLFCEFVEHLWCLLHEFCRVLMCSGEVLQRFSWLHSWNDSLVPRCRSSRLGEFWCVFCWGFKRSGWDQVRLSETLWDLNQC